MSVKGFFKVAALVVAGAATFDVGRHWDDAAACTRHFKGTPSSTATTASIIRAVAKLPRAITCDFRQP